MAFYKKKLIILIIAEVILIILHKIYAGAFSFNDGIQDIPIIYLLSIGLGIYISFYVIFLRCPKCKKPQIYRGVSPSQWYWPNDTCYFCGALLKPSATKENKTRVS